MTATNWRRRAACPDADPRAFDNIGDPDAALAYCRNCPVTKECLDWARRTGNYTGVAGGAVIVDGDVARGAGVRRNGLPVGYDPPDDEARYWWARARRGDTCPSARAGYLVWETRRAQRRTDGHAEAVSA